MAIRGGSMIAENERRASNGATNSDAYLKVPDGGKQMVWLLDYVNPFIPAKNSDATYDPKTGNVNEEEAVGGVIGVVQYWFDGMKKDQKPFALQSFGEEFPDKDVAKLVAEKYPSLLKKDSYGKPGKPQTSYKILVCIKDENGMLIPKIWNMTKRVALNLFGFIPNTFENAESLGTAIEINKEQKGKGGFPEIKLTVASKLRIPAEDLPECDFKIEEGLGGTTPAEVLQIMIDREFPDDVIEFATNIVNS